MMTTPSFMMTGAGAVEALQKEEAKSQQGPKNGPWRFWLKKGESASLTFLDGMLTEHGVFDTPMFYEHELAIGNKWGNFIVCPQENPGLEGACPACVSDKKPYLIQLFTVIDHREIQGKKGVYKDTVKLYAAKRTTLAMLVGYAKKRGGLAGWRVDVSRTTEDMSPKVGDIFDFGDKFDLKEIAAQSTETVQYVPIDYGQIIKPPTAEDFTAVGLSLSSVGGFAPAPGAVNQPTVTTPAPTPSATAPAAAIGGFGGLSALKSTSESDTGEAAPTAVDVTSLL
jgi:hypothetical protein